MDGGNERLNGSSQAGSEYRSLPPEIAAKVLLSAGCSFIRASLNWSRVTSFLESSAEPWCTLAGDSRLSMMSAKALLFGRHSLRQAIASGGERVCTTKTLQSDMTFLMCAGGRILCSSDDQSVRIFDITCAPLVSLCGHTGGIWTFDTDGRVVVTGSTDKTARVWDAQSGAPIHVLKQHRSTVRVLRLLGAYIATGSRDCTVGVWNTDGQLLHVLEGHSGSVRTLDISEEYLVTGSYDCTVRLWKYKQGKPLGILTTHGSRVYVVRIRGGFVASSGLDSIVRVTCVDGSFCDEHAIHTSVVAWIDFSGNCVISSGSDGFVVKYDFIDRRIKFIIQEQSPIKCQKIHGDLLIVATMTQVNVYSLANGRLIRRLLTAQMVARVEADGWRIVVGYFTGGDYYVSVYDYSHCNGYRGVHACGLVS